MLPAIEQRLAAIVDDLGWGKLLVEEEATRHQARQRAVLFYGEGQVEPRVQTIDHEVLPTVPLKTSRYLEQLFTEELEVEFGLYGRSPEEVEAARKGVLVALGGRVTELYDADGHHIRFAGARYVWPRALSKLRGETAVAMMLKFRGGVYHIVEEAVLPKATLSKAVGA